MKLGGPNSHALLKAPHRFFSYLSDIEFFMSEDLLDKAISFEQIDPAVLELLEEDSKQYQKMRKANEKDIL